MIDDQHANFAKKLAAIHGRGPSAEQEWPEGDEMDLGRAEAEAMIESFLGPDYPRRKVEHVIHAQKVFRENQQFLLRLYNLGEIGPGAYVKQLNSASDRSMAACHMALGDADFRALFGGSLEDVQRSVRVDPELFVEQQQQLLAETSSFHVRGA